MSSPAPFDFPTTGPVTATARIGAGHLTVSAGARNSAIVSVTPYDDAEASRAAAANTRVEFVDGELRVDTPDHSGGWLRRGGRVRVELRLPADSKLTSMTGSADVHLDGRFAAASVKSGSGDTTIEQVVGDLTVNSGSGDIRVGEVDGRMIAHTGSGDITVRAVTGDAALDSSSGDIRIDDAGGMVQVGSASGDVTVGAVRGSSLAVKTASGDVSVGVPRGRRVWLDLSTASGSTRSDLAMANEPPAEGAQLTLTVRTASGDIDIHRTLIAA